MQLETLAGRRHLHLHQLYTDEITQAVNMHTTDSSAKIPGSKLPQVVISIGDDARWAEWISSQEKEGGNEGRRKEGRNLEREESKKELKKKKKKA